MKGTAVREEISEDALNVNEKIRQELFSLAENPKVGIWVDSNIMMYSKNEFKNRLLKFPNLRTIPEVAKETRKRDKKTSYLLDRFIETGGVLVGRNSFQANRLDPLYDLVLSHSASYSPITQGAISDNLRIKGSTSPIEYNALQNLTDDCDFLETLEETIDLTSLLGLEEAHNTECEKLRRAWFKYHREREKRVANKTYLWTDEKLVASAITDCFAHSCISFILSTDWDPYVIIKQFTDNIIYQSVKAQIDLTEEPEAFDSLFKKRCDIIDNQNKKRRWDQSIAILDGELFDSCRSSDVFVWHYPSESFLSFSFPDTFKKWMSSVSLFKIEFGKDG